MYCTRCGVQLDSQFNFCPQCGQSTGRAAPLPPRTAGLSRPLEGKKIGGVCAGFARYMGMDVTFVRILWLVIAIFTGVGFVAYLIAWLLMPRDNPPPVVYVPQSTQPVETPS
jgi:phage shock protein C